MSRLRRKSNKTTDMNYENYTSGQKELAHTIASKLEHSGCTTSEGVEVLSDVIVTLLAYMAPSKAELTEYLDNKLLPYLRNTSIEAHDLRHKERKYNGKD